MRKTFIYWILAIIITLMAAVYQRVTGPTYEKREKVIIGRARYKIDLPRSISLDHASEVTLKIPDPDMT
ncbi:MAG: hypothetical protein NTW49_04950, partial [Bacteroidia bacterium]|nr:hypothetical protein [Bacteroidia bacterium]